MKTNVLLRDDIELSFFHVCHIVFIKISNLKIANSPADAVAIKTVEHVCWTRWVGGWVGEGGRAGARHGVRGVSH